MLWTRGDFFAQKAADLLFRSAAHRGEPAAAAGGNFFSGVYLRAYRRCRSGTFAADHVRGKPRHGDRNCRCADRHHVPDRRGTGEKTPRKRDMGLIRLLRVQHSVQHGRGRRALFSRACAGGKLDWGRAHGEFPAAVCRVPSRLLPVRRHDRVFHRGQPHRDAGRGGGGRAAVLHGRDHGRADPLGGRRPRTCLSERGHGRMLRRLSDAVLPDAAAPCRTGKAGAENPHKEPSFTGIRPPCHGGRTEIRHQHHGKPDGPQASGAELPH